MKILHVVNTYTHKNPQEQARLDRAAWTWQEAYAKQGILNYQVPTEKLPRTSDIELKDTRKLPYVRDLINHVMAMPLKEALTPKSYDPNKSLESKLISSVENSDCLIMLTNADTCLCSDLAQVLFDAGRIDKPLLFYSHRRNFNRFPRRILTSVDARFRGDKFHGVDMVAFTPQWWKENKFPDLVLGCEGWDWVFKFWPGSIQLPDCIYHEYHYPPYWMANRTCPAELHNKRLVWQWAQHLPNLNELMGYWPTLEEYQNA
jgi:hypothetical protein